MNLFNLTIPRRLRFLTMLLSAALIISIIISWPLWGSAQFYPDDLLIPSLSILSPYSGLLAILSVLFLVVSLFHEKRRIFILCAILINILLVALDFNRLQPWFYIYNSMILLLVFYNGRVDNASHFTYIFICLQIIPAAVYIYNGIYQLNPIYLNNEIMDSLVGWENKLSSRQFQFLMKASLVLPFIQLICGVGLLIKPIRFIIIPLSILFHVLLLILLIPSDQNQNYAMWFMNLVFIMLVLFLFSGKTEARYFSYSILLQKPLFYLVVFAFCIHPFLKLNSQWQRQPDFLVRAGLSNEKKVSVSESEFLLLPDYVKYFCEYKNGAFEVKLGKWCRHELLSDPVSGKINIRKFNNSPALARSVVKDSEDVLSSLQ
ncbi:MAG: hypothetical protein IPM51_09610 [Sphingobacteriaceae bacterium]|nr:hypothetical protein [Sphingobacteriaceae bacterium]